MSELRADDLEHLRALLYDDTGIVLDQGAGYVVERRLEPLLRGQGLGGVDVLVDELRRRPTTGLRRKTIEALTNGETHFFRDLPVFEMLRTHLIPRLLEARAARRELVIWSAACSTGQEPYSLAMMLARDFPELEPGRVRIIATDYSESHLARSRAGLYSQYDVNRGLPANLLVRWFEKRGEAWLIRPELKERVELAAINLVTDPPPAADIDLVLLRNVMIYWDDDTKRSVLERVRRALAPHGALILGAAETTLNLDPAYARVAAAGASYYALR